MMSSGASIRDVGRHAIRLSLARVAFERFCLQGFGQVTFDELAAAAGVSRSTFLRHFRTKEDAVLFVFDPVGATVAARIEAGDEAGAAVRAAADLLVRDVPELHAVLELVRDTPELRAGLSAKREHWLATALPVALAAAPDADEVVVEARLAAALACLDVALRRWGSGDHAELGVLLDRALSVAD